MDPPQSSPSSILMSSSISPSGDNDDFDTACFEVITADCRDRPPSSPSSWLSGTPPPAKLPSTVGLTPFNSSLSRAAAADYSSPLPSSPSQSYFPSTATVAQPPWPISSPKPPSITSRKVLSKEDTDTLNLCKSIMERGGCPPLMVVFDPLEGFTVEADKFIKDLTIITEYVGDVDYLTKRENDDGDSMMTLIFAADPLKSLVICPDKRSNIARFINDINNLTAMSRTML